MEDSTSREKILKKVRKALIVKSREALTNVDLDTSVYVQSEETPEIQFAQNFSESGGKFIFCMDEEELIENFNLLISENKWNKIFCMDEHIIPMLQKGSVSFSSDLAGLEQSDVSVTRCEALICRTGSIMTSSFQGRSVPVASPVHVVVGYTSQLVADVRDGLSELKKRYETGFPSSVSFITGPSRTADIEKTLVTGVHGPLDLYVFLLDDLGLE